MKLLDKLLATQVQTKQLSDVDVKKIQKQMAKKGFKISEEEIRARIKEYEDAYEFKRETKAKTIAFIATILSLLFLAIQDYLFKIGVLIDTCCDKGLMLGIGVLVIGVAWLCCLFSIKKKEALYWISLAGGCLLEIVLILLIVFI